MLSQDDGSNESIGNSNNTIVDVREAGDKNKIGVKNKKRRLNHDHVDVHPKRRKVIAPKIIKEEQDPSEQAVKKLEKHPTTEKKTKKKKRPSVKLSKIKPSNKKDPKRSKKASFQILVLHLF